MGEMQIGSWVNKEFLFGPCFKFRDFQRFSTQWVKYVKMYTAP